MKKLLKLDDTVEISKQLLGCYLSYKIKGQELTGKIVETEAYLSENDPACHAYKGITKRNRVMFGPPGFAYVYIIYGIYHCFNVVTAKEGKAEAVLIRALEPVSGIESMQENRNKEKLTDLCSGPGKLCIAFDISRKQNGLNLLSSNLKILPPEPDQNFDMITTTRIGLTQGVDLPLRFYMDKNPHVSVKAKEKDIVNYENIEIKDSL